MASDDANPYSTRGCMSRASPFLGVVVLALAVAACQPTIKIEAPDKPIVINLNIKIEQEVRVKIDRELDETFADNPDIFD
jgi:hypothetical protein